MNNLKVRTRLSLGFGFVCLLLAMTIAIGINKASMLNAGTIYIVSNKVPKMEMAHELLEHVDAVAIALRNMMLNTNDDDRKAQLASIMAARKSVDSVMEEFDRVMVTPAGRALMQSAIDERNKYRDGQTKLLALIQGGQDDEAKAYLTRDLRPILLAYKQALGKIITHETEAIAKTGMEAQQAYVDARNQLLGLGALSLVLATVIAYMITRRLLTQLGGEPTTLPALPARSPAATLASASRSRRTTAAA